MGNQNVQILPSMGVSEMRRDINCRLDLAKLIGPKNITFFKLRPKQYSIDDQINSNTLQQQQTLRLKQKSMVVEQDSQNQSAIDHNQGEAAIHQIKIKWNSFIKMKNKNYLEEYTVVREIGRGGFGTVSKVKNRFTEVFRAAKKIKKSSLALGEHQKLLAQMAIMLTLDHPNIARLFEVYDYKSSYVLILQLCEGGQLFKRIVSRKTNEEMAAGAMAQILQALHYLHSKKIIHRDLKPENMLFQKGTNNLKIIDFGIAIKHTSPQPLNTRIGTPYYIAPEVLCKNYSEKCDLWSAGVILYMMIGFKPPFNGDSQVQILQGILKNEPNYNSPFFKKMSIECLDFLQKLLLKNPDKRMSASEAYNHVWIQKYIHSKSLKVINQETIEHLSNFKFSNRFQAVVYTYIVSQIMTSEEKVILKQLFDKLDTNHDGVISSEQFKKALIERKVVSEDRVKFLMRVIDTNSSGEIDFTEFIVAAMDPDAYTQHQFQQAFNYFDIDHSGLITYDEIAAFLQDRENSEQQIKRIFTDVDQNNDGQISKQEFLHILSRKAKKDRQAAANAAAKKKRNQLKEAEKSRDSMQKSLEIK